MKKDFYLEIFSEEIPYKDQLLEEKFSQDFFTSNFPNAKTTVFASPNKLIVKITNLDCQVLCEAQKILGPKTSSQEQAILGFCKKYEITKQSLSIEGDYFYIILPQKTLKMQDVLNEKLNLFFNKLAQNFSKRIFGWCLPIRRISANFGQEILNFSYQNISSTPKIVHHNNEILDFQDRKKEIQKQISQIELQEDLKCISSNNLFSEVAGLCSFVQIVVANFDPKYLELPSQLIKLTAEKDQRYFLFEKDGKLSNKFAICVNGSFKEETLKKIASGNIRVLHARLEDAAYYIKTDSAKPLELQTQKLDEIIFHNSYGTLKMRCEEIVSFCQKLFPENQNLIEAAKLCKSDLTTKAVSSFTELQGVMGGFYLQKEGKNPEIWKAVRDSYKPSFDGDSLPETQNGKILSLIEKLTKIDILLKIGQKPTSSKDPFGIRRDAYFAIRLIIEGQIEIKIELSELLQDRFIAYCSKNIPNFKPTFFESLKHKQSILSMFQDVDFIARNFEKLSPYKRLFSIESKQGRAGDLQTEIEKEISKFSPQNLEDLLTNAHLFDTFFDTCLINSQDEELSSTRNNLIFETKQKIIQIANLEKIF